MAKPANRSVSRYGREAAQLLGVMIHNARLERRQTIADLVERAGVSRGLVQRVENGDVGCSIGAAFELAAIVGLHLFDSDETLLSKHLSVARDKVTMLPRSVRPATKSVNDDF